jgi:hypothetical protein
MNIREFNLVRYSSNSFLNKYSYRPTFNFNAYPVSYPLNFKNNSVSVFVCKI